MDPFVEFAKARKEGAPSREPKTPEQKEQERLKYTVPTKGTKAKEGQPEVIGFNDVIKDLVSLFSCYDVMASEVRSAEARHGPGAIVYYRDDSLPANMPDNTFVALDVTATRRDVKRRIAEINKYWSYSKKNARDSVEPEKLIGAHAPVWISDALLSFFEGKDGRLGNTIGPLNPFDLYRLPAKGEEVPDKLTPVEAGNSEQLINHMPMLKEGFTIKSNLISLFYNHVYQFGLSQDKLVAPSQIMQQTLGSSSHPSLLEPQFTNDGKAAPNRWNLLPSRNTNTGNYSSTFGILHHYDEKRKIAKKNKETARSPSLKPRSPKAHQEFPANKNASFPTYYFQSMICLNFIEAKRLRAMANVPGCPVAVVAAAAKYDQLMATGYYDTRARANFSFNDQLLREYRIRKECAANWAVVNAPYKAARAKKTAKSSN